jgi:hypothetical protein
MTKRKKEPEVNCTSFVFVAYQESGPMRFFLHVATLFRDHTTTFLSVTTTVNPIIIANKKLCVTQCVGRLDHPLNSGLTT